MKTKCINFFAGPGAGKSTLCAAVFAELKFRGVNCEMALEWVKDMIWEESTKVIENQFFVFGQQQHRLKRLKGKVNFIVTDAPILNSLIYDAKGDKDFEKIIIKTHNEVENINFFVKRPTKYENLGRIHSNSEALELDKLITVMLIEQGEQFNFVECTKEGVSKILDILEPHLTDLKN